MPKAQHLLSNYPLKPVNCERNPFKEVKPHFDRGNKKYDKSTYKPKWKQDQEAQDVENTNQNISEDTAEKQRPLKKWQPGEKNKNTKKEQPSNDDFI